MNTSAIDTINNTAETVAMLAPLVCLLLILFGFVVAALMDRQKRKYAQRQQAEERLIHDLTVGP